MVNAWLLYRRDCQLQGVPFIPFHDFSMAIGEGLLTANKPAPLSSRKRGRLSSSATVEVALPEKLPLRAHEPNTAMRFDLMDHFPQFSEKHKRCRLCSSLQKESFTTSSVANVR